MQNNYRCILAVVALAFLACASAGAQTAPVDLVGVWGGRLRFGPDVRGPLILLRDGTSWRADIAGFSVPVHVDGQRFSFALPDGKGSFRGQVIGREVVGHWTHRRLATPVVLEPDRANRWRGEVRPLSTAFTYYLPVTRASEGRYATYVRNPERNVGVFLGVTGIELQGDIVKLIGRRGDDAQATVAEGRYRDGVITIPLQRGTFELRKIDDRASSAFFPRGDPPPRYGYAAPLELDDGWPVSTVDHVGIDRAAIEKFVQMLIDMPMDSLATPQIHSLLIARHGKLVVEEYFHGFSRDDPHNLMSASKSWVAVLIGAAMHAGVPIGLSTPVYQTMLGRLPADLDPRKRAMTLEHLISMTAGYDCSDDEAPGNEDVMQSQTAEPDWYRYTLNVPMKTAPGDTIVYCSIEPHLAGGVLSTVAGEPLPEMFHRLVAKPLRMTNYHLFVSPTGPAYGGGGHNFTPREFMKLPQLMLNGGTWAGKRITSAEWARTSTSDLRQLGRLTRYGWLWNSLVFPYKGGTVRGFFAGGNGGQIFMAIPDLDLVIAFTAGNYNDDSMFVIQQVFIPNWILPAVQRLER